MTVAEHAAMPTSGAIEDSETDEIYRWRVWPAKQKPGQTVFVLLVVAGLSGLSGWLMNSWGWAVLALVLLLLSLRRFFFPTDHQLSAEGASARCLTTRKLTWDRVRRFPHDDVGGLLCVRAKPSRMDGMHGVPITFADNREEVIRRIQQYRELARKQSESATGENNSA